MVSKRSGEGWRMTVTENGAPVVSVWAPDKLAALSAALRSDAGRRVRQAEDEMDRLLRSPRGLA